MRLVHQIDTREECEYESGSDCYISVSSLDDSDVNIVVASRSNCHVNGRGLDDFDIDADEDVYIIISNSEQEQEQEQDNPLLEEYGVWREDSHSESESESDEECSEGDGDVGDSCFDSAEHDDWS